MIPLAERQPPKYKKSLSNEEWNEMHKDTGITRIGHCDWIKCAHACCKSMNGKHTCPYNVEGKCGINDAKPSVCAEFPTPDHAFYHQLYDVCSYKFVKDGKVLTKEEIGAML